MKDRYELVERLATLLGVPQYDVQFALEDLIDKQIDNHVSNWHGNG